MLNSGVSYNYDIALCFLLNIKWVSFVEIINFTSKMPQRYFQPHFTKRLFQLYILIQDYDFS